MREYLISFFEEFDYPAEARESLLCDYDKLKADPKAWELLEAKLKEYEETDTFRTGQVAEAAILASRQAKIGEFGGHFVLYCMFSKHLREIYAKNGMDMKIYHDSMMDLRIKLMECKEVKNEWGSFVCTWFDRFFQFTRFALGRLQFETEEYPAHLPTYEKHGITLKGGDLLINMHIPSGSRMPYESVIDSYKQAYEFYKDYRKDGKLAFLCDSWLIHRSMYEICEKGTNTYEYIKDFDILENVDVDFFHDAWRLFGVEYTGNPDDLPTNSGLRKNVVKWLKEGKKMGYAYGVMVFDGEKVLK